MTAQRGSATNESFEIRSVDPGASVSWWADAATLFLRRRCGGWRSVRC
jgi:hypothetical protein